LEAVDESFFRTAPKVVRTRARISRPRARVFDAVACDPAGWGRWFPGFSSDGMWQTAPPHGVGSVRSVRAFGVRYRETILAWDEGERWAFRIDDASVKLFEAFAEDYGFSDDDSGTGTLLEWTVAYRPRPGLRWADPLVPAGMGRVLRRAADRLAAVV
jgi:Polyketide cyclase / dehydrase and lipid transport